MKCLIYLDYFPQYEIIYQQKFRSNKDKLFKSTETLPDKIYN
jgi:hypothetical protein